MSRVKAGASPNNTGNRNLRQQCRDNAGKKDTVKSTGAADGRDRHAYPVNITQAQQISTDEHTQCATDVSERSTVRGIEQRGCQSRNQGCYKQGHSNTQTGDGTAESITGRCHHSQCQPCDGQAERMMVQQIQGYPDWNNAAAQVDGNLGLSLEAVAWQSPRQGFERVIDAEYICSLFPHVNRDIDTAADQ